MMTKFFKFISCKFNSVFLSICVPWKLINIKVHLFDTNMCHTNMCHTNMCHQYTNMLFQTLRSVYNTLVSLFIISILIENKSVKIAFPLFDKFKRDMLEKNKNSKGSMVSDTAVKSFMAKKKKVEEEKKGNYLCI